MDYQEAIQYIRNIQAEFGSEYTLDAVKALCRKAGSPDKKLRIIHIAGTNGKGSVGAYISNCLAMSGYTVGRYVSPALFDYREIIQKVTGSAFGVDVELISREETAENLSSLFEMAEEIKRTGLRQPTAFEIETVMALCQFVKWHVDVAVVETGLGGRLDATNLIERPVLSVFTEISLDHTALLGDSLEKIAEQKFGIIKPGVPVVSVRQEPDIMERLRSICQRRGLRLRIADPENIIQQEYSLHGTVFSYQGGRYRLSQLGLYQTSNAIVAVEAMHELLRLGFHKINSSSVQLALYHTRWLGRFEIISKSPFLLLDGAHNPSGALQLRKSLETYFPTERFTMVVGVFRDKDYENILRIMMPLAERVYTLTPPGERGLEADTLADIIRDMQGRREIPVTSCPNIRSALIQIQRAGIREKIVVFGSLSFLHDVYTYFDTAMYI